MAAMLGAVAGAALAEGSSSSGSGHAPDKPYEVVFYTLGALESLLLVVASLQLWRLVYLVREATEAGSKQKFAAKRTFHAFIILLMASEPLAGAGPGMESGDQEGLGCAPFFSPSCAALLWREAMCALGCISP